MTHQIQTKARMDKHEEDWKDYNSIYIVNAKWRKHRVIYIHWRFDNT